MNYSIDDSLPVDRPPREGAYDVQLPLPGAFIEAPRPIQTIVKRDGREAPYDARKIAEGIFRAAQSIGGEDWDRAQSLASGVTLYLTKNPNGNPPDVDQVHDAVERVLIEMGHVRTALAYVRFRDKRERMRKLQTGGARALLKELAEARREQALTEVRVEDVLSIRTSDETLTDWNRERIVESLVRETGLEKETAALIALEVEQQIRSADVGALTASLVRELVGAKLIEHGLAGYRHRQMRLGVPMCDAEAIICTPHEDNRPRAFDPESTNRLLAERVKKEFALTRVFSQDVADAHLRGEIHLHGLGFIDRIESIVQPVEFIKRFGLSAPDGQRISHPARRPDTLVAQMAGFESALRRHVFKTISWDAVNFYFAPYFQDLDRRALREIAQVLLYEFAYRLLSRGDFGPPAKIGISLDVPPYLNDVEATGPGGRPLEHGYDSFLYGAQQFAWTLVEAYKEIGNRPEVIPAPTPVVQLSRDFFRTPGHEGFLNHVAELVNCWDPVVFEIERESGAGAREFDARRPLTAVAQQVTLNLPRAAIRAEGVQRFEAELRRLMELAATAHAQKRAFLHKLLLMRKAGPLAMLASEHDGRPFLDLDECQFLVGVTGLDECVLKLTRLHLHESETAAEMGERILAMLRTLCARFSDQAGVRLTMAPCADHAVCGRFALLDIDSFGGVANALLDVANDAAEIAYTRGAEIVRRAALTPMERLRIEARLHPLLGYGAVTRLPRPDPDTSPASIAGFIEKAFRQTPCSSISFTDHARNK